VIDTNIISVLMGNDLIGGCLCRAIRYKIDQIFDAVYCHCSMCRKSGGAPVIAWAIVKVENFHLIQGSTTDYASSEQGYRCFCSVCGSLMFYRHQELDYIEVTLGTLDNPELVEPQVHLFADDQLKWLKLQDSHPRYKDNVMPHPSKRNIT
jgi:hypothetical protein